MIKKLLDWLIDTYLYNYVVSREDFDSVQQREEGARSYIDHLIQEQKDLYNSLYSRSFQPLEQYGESVEAEYIQQDRIDLREFQYRYEFRIPHRVFYSLRDLTNLFREGKQVVIAKLTQAFGQHMQKNLFRDL